MNISYNNNNNNNNSNNNNNNNDNNINNNNNNNDNDNNNKVEVITYKTNNEDEKRNLLFRHQAFMRGVEWFLFLLPSLSFSLAIQILSVDYYKKHFFLFVLFDFDLRATLSIIRFYYSYYFHFR